MPSWVPSIEQRRARLAQWLQRCPSCLGHQPMPAHNEAPLSEMSQARRAVQYLNHAGLIDAHQRHRESVKCLSRSTNRHGIPSTGHEHTA